MTIRASTAFSIASALAAAVPIALGLSPHGSPWVSALVFLVFPGCALVALVLGILRVMRERSRRNWIEVAVPCVLLLCAGVLLV